MISAFLQSQIGSYLYGSISIETLRAESAPLCIAADSGDDPEALRIANQMIGDFSDMDEGLMSEKELRQSLANLLFSQSVSRYFEFRFEPFTAITRTKGSSTVLLEPDRIEFAGTGRALVPA